MTRSDDGGFAMVVAILVVTLLAVTAVTVVEVASRDILRTRRESALFAARGAAEAALDAFAARSASDAAFVDVTIAGAGWPLGSWTRPDSFGRPMPCRNDEDLCATTAVRAADVIPGDTERRLRAAVVEVIGRAGCRAARHCTYVRLQQRLERRTFFDFLLHTDFELMDPALLPAGAAPGEADWQRASCETDAQGRRLGALSRPAECMAPAWFGAGSSTAGDDVHGPVHTNDDRIPHCGDPIFRGAVETTATVGDTTPASPGSTFVSQEGAVPACGPPTKVRHEPRLVGPDAVLRKAPAIQMPPAVAHLDSAASGGHGLRWPGPGEPALLSADVTLEPAGTVSVMLHDATGATICACAQPTPDSGVVFIDAPTVRIRGSSPFPITIATTGAAIVDGDVRTTPDALVGTTIGIMSIGPIRLQMADRASGAITDRHLAAVALVSLEHTVVTDRWNDPTVCALGCPTLDLTGAIVGRYRPVIGSYDTLSGAPSGGYRKQLAYDARLRDRQPPYMLLDGQAPWRRVDAVETGAGTPGLQRP